MAPSWSMFYRLKNHSINDNNSDSGQGTMKSYDSMNSLTSNKSLFTTTWQTLDNPENLHFLFLNQNKSCGYSKKTRLNEKVLLSTQHLC